MHDAARKGGAMPMAPEPARPALGAKEGDAGGKAGADRPGERPVGGEAAPGKEGSRKHADRLNPYCGCEPCRCEPPCTCGLEIATRETRTEWLEEAGALIHRITETWRPRAGARRAGERPGA